MTNNVQHDEASGANRFIHWSKTQAFLVTSAFGVVLALGHMLTDFIRSIGYDGETTVQLIAYVLAHIILWIIIAWLLLLPIIIFRNLCLRGLTGKALEQTGGKWRVTEALIFSPLSALLLASRFLASDRVMDLKPSLGKLGYALIACALALLVMAVAAALMTAIRNALFR
ncbi:MAG: hypothetical protein AAGL24_04720 [Pseudomonadota bacterium]